MSNPQQSRAMPSPTNLSGIAGAAHKAAFRIRQHSPLLSVRVWWYRMMGMQVGRGTRLPRIIVTWPHQVKLGSHCEVEPGIFFKYDGPWREGPSIRIGSHVFIGARAEFNIQHGLDIGNDCLVASGCRLIDHLHGMDRDRPVRAQPCTGAPIVMEDDSGVGANSVVLKGVTIGRGAFVGANSLVLQSIPPYEIWLGVPARKVGERISARNI